LAAAAAAAAAATAAVAAAAAARASARLGGCTPKSQVLGAKFSAQMVLSPLVGAPQPWSRQAARLETRVP
jgi:hypothetical protein